MKRLLTALCLAASVSLNAPAIAGDQPARPASPSKLMLGILAGGASVYFVATAWHRDQVCVPDGCWTHEGFRWERAAAGAVLFALAASALGDYHRALAAPLDSAQVSAPPADGCPRSPRDPEAPCNLSGNATPWRMIQGTRFQSGASQRTPLEPSSASGPSRLTFWQPDGGLGSLSGGNLSRILTPTGSHKTQ
jgi:hypothetical protein